MLKEKYRKDLFEIISKDFNYLNNGGIIAKETEGALNVSIQLFYSIYLYLKEKDTFSKQLIDQYVREMYEYEMMGSYEYHLVNTIELSKQSGQTMAYKNCNEINFKNIMFIDDVFEGLYAIVKTENTFNIILKYFEEIYCLYGEKTNT